MSSPPKAPPRFIPTLTEVVGTPARQAPAAAPLAWERGPDAPQPAALRTTTASALPPVLTAQAASTRTPQEAGAAPAAAPPARLLPAGFEEYVVHRVMQRVDAGLERQLRDAIATVVQEQTRSLLPRLREEVESVVRHVVYEAVSEELATGELPGATPR